jgi:hypothetical protein
MLLFLFVFIRFIRGFLLYYLLFSLYSFLFSILGADYQIVKINKKGVIQYV